jgi:predicted Zn-dependent peptidase
MADPVRRHHSGSRKDFSMRTAIRIGLGLAAALSLFSLVSCGKNEQEAQKFNRASDETFKRDMSDVSTVKLANGISLYLQEERTDNQVAIEVVYRAGYTRDPRGKVQLAHLTEHMAMHCATGPYKKGESMSLVKDHKGMISAEAVADFIHVDYVVDAARLDETLAIEASRLKELNCDDETLQQQAKDVVDEFAKSMASKSGALTRVSLGALTHIMYYGQKHVPMQASLATLTVDDVHRFHDTHYRPDDMVIVLIGNFKKSEAEALVRKHFESIPSRPSSPEPTLAIKSSTRATWDVPAKVTYYVVPGPIEDPKERLVLTMFGSFLQQVYSQSPDVYENCRSVYVSNQSYPVGRLPFFIFVQAKDGFDIDIVSPAIFSRLDQAITLLDDDNRVNLIKTGTLSFVTSSGLQADEPDYPMMHHQVIGQEALNVCLKHMLLDGRTPDQFADEVEAITPDEFRAIIKKRLDRKALLTVAIDPRT